MIPEKIHQRRSPNIPLKQASGLIIVVIMFVTIIVATKTIQKNQARLGASDDQVEILSYTTFEDDCEDTCQLTNNRKCA